MAGYDITKLSTALEFDTTNLSQAYVEKLTDTRYVVAWQRSLSIKYVQAFDVNRSTGVITTLSSPLAFYTGSVEWNLEPSRPPSVVRIDDTHFAIFWTGANADGFCRTFQVNAGTGAVTVWGSELEFDKTNGTFNSAVLMANDGTNARILNTWVGGPSTGQGMASIFTVNMSTGAMVLTGTPVVFMTPTTVTVNSVAKISNTKAIVVCADTATDGQSIILDINTSTWAVSLGGSDFEWFNNTTIQQNSVEIVSQNPLIALNAFCNGGGFGIRPLSINTSTWAITNLGSVTTGMSSLVQNNQKRVLLRIDDTHFIVFYKGASNEGVVETRSLDTSTGATSMIDQDNFQVSFALSISVCDMGDGLFVAVWSDSGNDGYTQAFQIEMPEPLFNPHISRRRLLV